MPLADAKACTGGVCWLALKWWGHEGSYCSTKGVCWLTVGASPVRMAITVDFPSDPATPVDSGEIEQEEPDG